jgi:hypothetical protein
MEVTQMTAQFQEVIDPGIQKIYRDEFFRLCTALEIPAGLLTFEPVEIEPLPEVPDVEDN